MTQLNLDQILNSQRKKYPVFKNKKILTDQHVPDALLHREHQINQLVQVLAPALHGEKTSNIFLFGTVGTGKSVSMRYVASEMQRRSDKIKIIYVNCKMKRVSDTEYRLLAELCREFGTEVPATGLPTDAVYKTFFSLVDSREWSIILVLDEIDALVRKTGDDILYNMTRINQDLQRARLSIIGISNNMSFTDALDPRVKSSLSEEEIIFPPYNANQLQDILSKRASEAFADGVLDNTVILKCAALAAQEHGDARRALDLLRISGEIAERESSRRVEVRHVDRAEEKLDFDRIAEAVRAQPKQSLTVLASVLTLIEQGQDNIQTGDVFVVYERICPRIGLKCLTQRRVSDLIAELDVLSVINTRTVSKGRYGRTREIRILLGESLLNKIRRILEDNYLLEPISKQQD